MQWEEKLVTGLAMDCLMRLHWSIWQEGGGQFHHSMYAFRPQRLREGVYRWVAMCGNNILLITGISVYLSVNFSFNVKCSALSKEPYDQNTTELQWIPCADLIDMNFLICKKLVNLIYFSS